MSDSVPVFPSRLPVDLCSFKKLSHEQAGHLRHFYNISAALDGQWPHMGTQEPDQAFLDAYRYQLATMVYAAGITHYHHLPVMRGLFKPLIRSLIGKMLRREVWSYWYLTSQSGNRLDPDLKELRKPWADPIVKENIMYSGHLLLMTSLYAMLFDDDEFEKPGSLTFNWAPMFWGMGPESFSYDNRSLQAAILKEMEQTGWVGVCCEPNLVFVVCNQFPIIAMRYNDVRDGTNTVGEVLEKYWPALNEKKMISSDGLFVDWLAIRQGVNTPARGIGFTAWANAFMNTWNSKHIRSHYDNQAMGHITNIEGKIELQHPAVGMEIRRLAKEEDAPIDSPKTIQQAKDSFLESGKSQLGIMQPLFGYVVKWLSELGKTTELQGLLDYADARLNPTWEHGGLFYPRNDQIVDEKGDWTFVDPFSGNAAIGYARLNVEDGQKKIWEHPWTRQELESRPWVNGFDLSQGLDCLRGHWDEKLQIIVITLKAWTDKPSAVKFSVMNLEKGNWAVYGGGKLVDVHCLTSRDDIEVAGTIDPGEEMDFVILNDRALRR